MVQQRNMITATKSTQDNSNRAHFPAANHAQYRYPISTSICALFPLLGSYSPIRLTNDGPTNGQSESLGVGSIVMIVKIPKEQVSIYKRSSILGKAKSTTRIAVGLLSCRKVVHRHLCRSSVLGN
jgi:hypothetical protein